MYFWAKYMNLANFATLHRVICFYWHETDNFRARDTRAHVMNTSQPFAMSFCCNFILPFFFYVLVAASFLLIKILLHCWKILTKRPLCLEHNVPILVSFSQMGIKKGRQVISRSSRVLNLEVYLRVSWVGYQILFSLHKVSSAGYMYYHYSVLCITFAKTFILMPIFYA